MTRRYLARPPLVAGLVGLAAIAAGLAYAGPERVSYPTGYKDWVKYTVVEHPDRKIVRNMYVNPEAHERAKPGEPMPDGTVLVMEDMKIRLDSSGNPEIGPDGRFVPTGEVTAIWVMQKEKGWGNGIAADLRNGDWDYSAFTPEGSLRPNLKTAGCFSCHMNRKGERDFTFTYAKALMDADKR
ncbi:MAG: cytochrome P460 family protein [Alphaproteobacteria bacterium]